MFKSIRRQIISGFPILGCDANKIICLKEVPANSVFLWSCSQKPAQRVVESVFFSVPLSTYCFSNCVQKLQLDTFCDQY